MRGLNWLGDAVMSTPALLRLRQARPAARITLLSPKNWPASGNTSPFSTTCCPSPPPKPSGRSAAACATKHFTAALAFPNSLRAALELWLARIPRRVGAARPGA